MRDATVAYLGSKCIRCGFSDVRILHVDHIFNDGAEERRKHRIKNGGRHSDMTRYYFNHMTEGRYQLLCPNCNNLKEYLRRNNASE